MKPLTFNDTILIWHIIVTCCGLIRRGQFYFISWCCWVLASKRKKPMNPCFATSNKGGYLQVICSPWGHKESDTTERLHFHFSLSCMAEGNGNPLQCSCLENPRDGGAWWAAVYGVAQSRTWLKWLGGSSSRTSGFSQWGRYSISLIWVSLPTFY